MTANRRALSSRDIDPTGGLTASAAPRVRPQAYRWAGLGLLGVAAVAGIWANRDTLLGSVGRFLVSEDPPARVDVIVLSEANAAGDALEVARLYREGYAAEIVIPASQPEPLAPAIRDLGIPFLAEGDLAGEILARSGVPAEAVHLLPGFVDGTDTEIAAVAAFADQRRPTSLLFVTSRSHTARARWLLRRALPDTTRLLVRAPRTDSFSADAWWRSRADSREVLTEYLRWFNSAVLGDPWAAATSRPSANGHPG